MMFIKYLQQCLVYGKGPVNVTGEWKPCSGLLDNLV